MCSNYDMYNVDTYSDNVYSSDVSSYNPKYNNTTMDAEPSMANR